MGGRGAFWTMAVRALAIVAFLLVGHDVLMTSPAAAHELSPSSDHVHADASSMMTMGSPDAAMVDDATGDDLLAEHPDPMHEDSDCGVVRDASMPADQSVSPPDAAQAGVACTLDPATDGPAAAKITSDALAPTQDPRTKRALLQIFRV